MKLLLSTVVRSAASQWVYRSCRGIAIKPVLPEALSWRRTISKLDGPARTRFAPSPTGYLHLGSLRTALFNYLIAKSSGGQFLLRIEDTDQTRTVHDAEQRLFQDLEWAGIEWDEGPRVGGKYGPYKQSERLPIYKVHVDRLLESGHAYRCFCTMDRLNKAAAVRHQHGIPPTYDGHCRHIPKEVSDDRAAKGEFHAVRFLSSKALTLPFIDINYGRIRTVFQKDSGDIILLKQDGFPTYHLANVVDDHLMEITHVIRGSEWMSSTPKHTLLYSALGWEPPNFCHVSLLVDKNNQKLSKRLESVNIAELRNNGIFPEVLNNYVALLGWSHQRDNDVMNMQELVSEASFKFTKDDCTVSLEKLWFLQKQHAKRYAEQDAAGIHSPLDSLAVKPIVKLLDDKVAADKSQYPQYQNIPKGQARFEYVQSLLRADAGNYTTPSEFIARNRYFFDFPSADSLRGKWEPMLFNAPKTIPQTQPKTLIKLFQTFLYVPDEEWTLEGIKEHTKGVIEQGIQSTVQEFAGQQGAGSEEEKKELQKLLQRLWSRLVHSGLRWALVGGMPGPDGAKTMLTLGKAESLRRLERAWELLSDAEENEGFGSMDSMSSPEADLKVEDTQTTKKAAPTKQASITDKENEAFGSMDG